MDEHNDNVIIASDEEIFDQLRQYGDALAARSGDAPITVPGDVPESKSRRRAPVLALAAAAVAVLIGSASWMISRDGSESIRSTDEQTPTSVDDVEDGVVDNDDVDDERNEAVATSPLMPDPSRWAITEAYESQSSPRGAASGVWAWQLDGQTYVLLDDVGLEDLGPLSQADVEVGDGRVMIGWLDGDQRLGLQGYGVDDSDLRMVATALERTGNGWTLPGADVLIAEAGGQNRTNSDDDKIESVQVGYSPITSQGTADLSAVITATRREGTEADLYRELFEASSLGQVSETTVAGERAYFITGPFGSYGLTFGDGWISSWQTMKPDIDLAKMMGTIRAATSSEWDQATADADDVVAQAVAASVADLNIDVADPADDPVLPRYAMPEPWSFEWVTDMGLWSAEERAQREALSAAHAPPGGFDELVRTQGFVRSDPQLDQAGSLPFALPEMVVQVHRRQTDEPLDPEWSEGEPLSFLGLDGFLTRFEMYDPTAEGGSRTEINVVAAQGPLVVTIDAPFADEDTVRRFAEGLSIPGDDLSRGVWSTDDDFELLLEVPGEAGNGSSFFSRWLAAYTTPEESDDFGATLSVESMTFEQLQLELFRWGSWEGSEYRPVAGGRYLASQYERPLSVAFDEDGNVITGDDADVRRGTTLLRYDPDEQILVTLNLGEGVDTTITLMEQLTEVDVETWRELVEPHNAKPLQPR